MDAIVFTWCIDNFVNQTERFLISPRFTIPDYPQIEWRLELYPLGNFSDTADFVSLYIYKITDRFEVEVDYDVAMVGANGQVSKQFSPNAVFKLKDNQVYGGIDVTRNRLVNNLLVDGSLNIQVRNVKVIRLVELKDRLEATVFSWDIDNFKSLKETELTSDKFIIPGHPLIKWQLICYPNSPIDKDYVTIYVKKCTNECEIEIEYQLAMVFGDDEEKSETATDFTCFKDDRKINDEWSSFILRDWLINDGYLIDGTLKIQFKVFRVVRIVYLDEYFNHRYNKELLDVDSFKHFDFRLKTNDKTFEAHKAILARKSPYFKNMFDCDLKENKENEVNLSQFQPEVIQEVLRFIYTGQLQNFDDLSEQLIFAADYFQMDYLKTLCQKNMTFRISLDNCLKFLVIADQLNASPLKEAGMRFLNKNKNCIDKHELKRFFKDHSDFAIEWIFWVFWDST